MNCPRCDVVLVKRTRRVRASGPTSCLAELIGVLLIFFTLVTIIGPIIGLIFLFLGHSAAYRKVTCYRCPDCGTDYPDA